jgi:hypothetical protein
MQPLPDDHHTAASPHRTLAELPLDHTPDWRVAGTRAAACRVSAGRPYVEHVLLPAVS